MGATLRVREVVEITRRGPVVFADLIAGTARIGQVLAVPGQRDAALARIAGIEFADSIEPRESWLGLRLEGAPPIAELGRLLASGTEIRLEDPPAGRPPVCHRALRRFWFPATRGFGIGVTACSLEEAQALADEALGRYQPGARFTDVVEDVDVSTLDRGHVLPNLGLVTSPGVWFPNENLH